MLSRESKNFIRGFNRRAEPIYKETIEGLTAQISYRSLDEKSRMEYGVYSGFIVGHPTFFLLSNEELALIERNLPPYPSIVKYVYKKVGISYEGVEEMSKKRNLLYSLVNRRIATKKKEIKQKLVSEEYEKIMKEYSKQISRKMRKVFIPFYLSSSIILLQIVLQTGNPYLLLPWLSTVAPYYLFTELSYKLKDRKISNAIQKTCSIYYFSTNPIGATQSMLKFGVGSSLFGTTIEKGWRYIPKSVRKSIDASEKFLSGIKVGKFDEREIREELYENSKAILSSLPDKVFDKFREDIDNGIIEVENPREILREPFSFGYWERRKVLEKRGDKWEIVDKRYVRKLAGIQGMFLDDFENLILRRPYEFLRIDVDRNGNIVYAKDVIGIYPIKRPYGLRKGIEMKEIEACYLGIYHNYLYASILKEQKDILQFYSDMLRKGL